MSTPAARPASYDVVIDESGERFQCRPDEHLLKAMERLNRRGIPVGCRGGGCGVCKIRVLAGCYTTRRMSRAHVSAAEEATGIGLACCVLPTSDLRVTVLGSMQAALLPAMSGESR